MAQPFSFHCNICYEPFDSQNRPPVVLPCGHTFLCAQCSKQLKNCMECRRPLFTTSKRNDSPLSARGNPASEENHNSSSSSHNSFNNSFSRSSYTTSYRQRTHTINNSNNHRNNNGSNHKRPTPLTKEPLPIPKNHVLMSLMETAEKKKGGLLFEDDDEKAYESGDDDECVLTGIQHLTSDAGTYVIRDANGLLLYPQEEDQNEEDCTTTDTTSDQDKKERVEETDDEDHDEDDDSPQKYMLQQSSGELAIESHGSMEVVMSPNPYKKKKKIMKDHNQNKNKKITTPTLPIRLPYGTRIQVLSFKHRKAQLSRKRGYIRVVDVKQLVKVGDFTDKASEVESLLASIVKDKQDLQQKIQQMDRKMKDYFKMEHQLKNELQEIEKEESENAHPNQAHSAVAVLPPSQTPTKNAATTMSKEQHQQQQSPTRKTMIIERTNSQESCCSKASFSEAEIKHMGLLFLEMDDTSKNGAGDEILTPPMKSRVISIPSTSSRYSDHGVMETEDEKQDEILHPPSSVVRHLPGPRLSGITVGSRSATVSADSDGNDALGDISSSPLHPSSFNSPGRKGGRQALTNTAETLSSNPITCSVSLSQMFAPDDDDYFSNIKPYQPHMGSPVSPPSRTRTRSIGGLIPPQSRSPTSSPVVSRGNVDFRTGMSGHYGLGRITRSPKPKSSPHQIHQQQQNSSHYLAQYQGSSQRSIRMMSEHRGAAQIGKLGKNNSSTGITSPVPSSGASVSSISSVGFMGAAGSFISRLDNTNTGTW